MTCCGQRVPWNPVQHGKGPFIVFLRISMTLRLDFLWTILFVFELMLTDHSVCLVNWMNECYDVECQIFVKFMIARQLSDHFLMIRNIQNEPQLRSCSKYLKVRSTVSWGRRFFECDWNFNGDIFAIKGRHSSSLFVCVGESRAFNLQRTNSYMTWFGKVSVVSNAVTDCRFTLFKTDSPLCRFHFSKQAWWKTFRKI